MLIVRIVIAKHLHLIKTSPQVKTRDVSKISLKPQLKAKMFGI